MSIRDWEGNASPNIKLTASDSSSSSVSSGTFRAANYLSTVVSRWLESAKVSSCKTRKNGGISVQNESGNISVQVPYWPALSSDTFTTQHSCVVVGENLFLKPGSVDLLNTSSTFTVETSSKIFSPRASIASAPSRCCSVNG